MTFSAVSPVPSARMKTVLGCPGSAIRLPALTLVESRQTLPYHSPTHAESSPFTHPHQRVTRLCARGLRGSGRHGHLRRARGGHGILFRQSVDHDRGAGHGGRTFARRGLLSGDGARLRAASRPRAVRDHRPRVWVSWETASTSVATWVARALSAVGFACSRSAC